MFIKRIAVTILHCMCHPPALFATAITSKVSSNANRRARGQHPFSDIDVHRTLWPDSRREPAQGHNILYREGTGLRPPVLQILLPPRICHTSAIHVVKEQRFQVQYSCSAYAVLCSRRPSDRLPAAKISRPVNQWSQISTGIETPHETELLLACSSYVAVARLLSWTSSFSLGTRLGMFQGTRALG